MSVLSPLNLSDTFVYTTHPMVKEESFLDSFGLCHHVVCHFIRKVVDCVKTTSTTQKKSDAIVNVSVFNVFPVYKDVPAAST